VYSLTHAYKGTISVVVPVKIVLENSWPYKVCIPETSNNYNRCQC